MRSTEIAKHRCATRAIKPSLRGELAMQAMQRKQTITTLAKQNNVSRQFIHKQKDKACEAVNQAFEAETEEKDKTLFTINVTRTKLCMMILGLTLICGGSYRKVSRFFKDIFDYEISIGTIHNVLKDNEAKAKRMNEQQAKADCVGNLSATCLSSDYL